MPRSEKNLLEIIDITQRVLLNQDQDFFSKQVFTVSHHIAGQSEPSIKLQEPLFFTFFRTKESCLFFSSFSVSEEC